MSTKLIAALLILLVVWGAYRMFSYYKEVQEKRWIEQEQATAEGVDPETLDGVPRALLSSLRNAEAQGAAALGQWLETNGNYIRDPRKAWIQLDYCTLIAREDPQEAKAVFADVERRLREDSPVYPRLKQLQRSFE